MMLNETHAVTTKVVNGKTIVTGAVWKWGPLLRQKTSPKQAKPTTRN